jgi:sulfur carrier protein ThiS
LISVRVTLHSYLQELLPPEAEGQAVLNVAEGTTISDLIHKFDLPSTVAVAVDETIERDRNRVLQDGDHVRFLRPGAGG